jgi:hypothetical protein
LFEGSDYLDFFHVRNRRYSENWQTIFRVLIVGKKQTHSGYLSAVCNYILITHQATFLDNHPKVMILPCLPADEIWSWNGRRFQALCICADEEIYRAIGACQCDESPLIGESSIMCDDERVQIAPDGFRDVIKVVLPLMQSEDSGPDDDAGKKIRSVWNFLCGSDTSPFPYFDKDLKGWQE